MFGGLIGQYSLGENSFCWKMYEWKACPLSSQIYQILQCVKNSMNALSLRTWTAPPFYTGGSSPRNPHNMCCRWTSSTLSSPALRPLSSAPTARIRNLFIIFSDQWRNEFVVRNWSVCTARRWLDELYALPATDSGWLQNTHRVWSVGMTTVRGVSSPMPKK